MRRLLARHGYVLEDGVWEHPETGSRFRDAFVQHHHALLLARFTADKLAGRLAEHTNHVGAL
jgi:hypothetical protein